MGQAYVLDETKPHLGGNFAEIDPACWCPNVWSYIVSKYNVKTAMDVGSGNGRAAEWFAKQGLTVTAIEGLEKNVENSAHPAVLHDITTGPYINPVDFVNCIEVVEHIEETFLDNLLTTLCQGNYILITHALPGQKGWHHVNCQPSDYWIDHIESKGFEFLSEESNKIRKIAEDESAIHIAKNGLFFKKK